MGRRAKSPKAARTDRNGLTPEICSLLVERVKDYAIFMLDPSGTIVSWNDGAERIKGYTAEEIIGRHMSIFYTPEDIDAGLPARLLGLALADGRVENEGWRVRKDGSRFWCDVVITALHDDHGTLRGYGKVTRDLTDRKEAERELGEVSGRLLQFQDEERRKLAAELHDSTSPLLTRLVARLYNVRQRSPGQDAELTRAVDESLALAEATTNMVRTVSNLLHPPLLDQAGLLTSLKWLIEALSSKTTMRIEAQFPDLMPRPPHDQEVALFRLTQEWLGSMERIGVTSARVRMVMSKDRLELRIEATDRGFRGGDEERRLRGERALVVAYRERLRQLGGRLDFDIEGSGITATLPVRGSMRSGGLPNSEAPPPTT